VKLTLRRALLGAVLSVLLATVIVRASVADRSPLRGLASQGSWFASAKVDDGQTVTRELSWTPERDVYVVGWNALLAEPPDAVYEAELTLFDDATRTRIFAMVQHRSRPGPSARWETAMLPDGTGYRVAAGRRLVLRLRIKNAGREVLRTEVSGAQVRYVPAD
jgi:hypothetical protein